jgi:hypothetical protein
MRNTYAIRDLARNCLVTMVGASAPYNLEMRYPATDFEVVNMTDKGPLPVREGSVLEDLTIELGEWKWKVTEEETALRALQKNQMRIRAELVSLMLRKEMADTMGPPFADVALAFQTRINAIQAELAGL